MRFSSPDGDHPSLKLASEKRSEFDSHVAGNVLQKPRRARHGAGKRR
jgi:hypothetical protein